MKTDSATRSRVLIAPDDLERMLGSPQPPTVLAIQSVNPYTGADSRAGIWIPGAIDAEVYSDFAAPAAPQSGQRPLPRIDDLQSAARRWGLRQGRTVVVYDSDGAMTAARAWWVLRWAGLADVRVLDGGMPAWLRAGHAAADHAGMPDPSDIFLTPGQMPEFGADTALTRASDGVLLDARIRPNYIGGSQTVGDPDRGHIPGAISAPARDSLLDPGHFADSTTLAEYFRGVGVREDRPVGVYCGAGMSAAHTVLALAAIGVDAAMYPGSWSQWIADPARPRRRGAQP